MRDLARLYPVGQSIGTLGHWIARIERQPGLHSPLSYEFTGYDDFNRIKTVTEIPDPSKAAQF
jgi:hypothetical protein